MNPDRPHDGPRVRAGSEMASVVWIELNDMISRIGIICPDEAAGMSCCRIANAVFG